MWHTIYHIASHKNVVSSNQLKQRERIQIMATARSIDSGLHLEPREIPGRRFFSGLTTYLSAIREASAAAHQYETLTRHGVPHEQAVERVFDEHFSGGR
jgi:hypothetical protein